MIEHMSPGDEAAASFLLSLQALDDRVITSRYGQPLPYGNPARPARFTYSAGCRQSCPDPDNHNYAYYSFDPSHYTETEVPEFDVPTLYLEESTLIARAAKDISQAPVAYRDLLLATPNKPYMFLYNTRHTLPVGGSVMRTTRTVTITGVSGDVSAGCTTRDESHELGYGSDFVHVRSIAGAIRTEVDYRTNRRR